LAEYRVGADDPWILIRPDGTPIVDGLSFDWVKGGVNDGSDYARGLEQAQIDARFAEALPRILDKVGRFVLGPAKVTQTPSNKTALLRDILTQIGQPVEGVESRDALYLLAAQCGLAVPRGAHADERGCIGHPLYLVHPPKERWTPEVRLIPVPSAWTHGDLDWQSVNSSAAVMPPSWMLAKKGSNCRYPLD
jgi:hypothetical protein